MLCLLGSGTVLRIEEKALQPSFLKSGLVVPLGPSLLWTTLANTRERSLLWESHPHPQEVLLLGSKPGSTVRPSLAFHSPNLLCMDRTGHLQEPQTLALDSVT